MSTIIDKPAKTTYSVFTNWQGEKQIITTLPTQVTTSSVDHENITTVPEEVLILASTEPITTGSILPPLGKPCEMGEIYYEEEFDRLVLCRQDHNRDIYPIDDIPALWSVFRNNPDGQPWIANELVAAGQTRTSDGKTWEVITPHTTQAGWEPENTPALWNEVVVVPPGPQPWVQPTGAHDAYQTGNQVTHNGSTWESTVDNNVWAPGVYGWIII